MEQILDTEKELNVKLFDEIVLNAYNANSPNKAEAEKALLKFKSLPNSWTKVDHILKNSEKQQSHYVALQLLEESVKTRWSLFDVSIKQGIRRYIFELVIERSKTVNSENYVLQELNMILVEIAKRDWPKYWPTFITDLINISQSISMNVCRNSLDVLKKLNEEVFIFSEDNITTVRKRILKNQLKVEFPQIFGFIKVILEYSQKTELDDKLLESTLGAFQCFCKAMPSDFIFSTDIVDYIVEHLNSKHSVACINCLQEIVELRKNGSSVTSELQNSEENKILKVHREAVAFLSLYFAKFENEKISDRYRTMPKDERIFVHKFSQLLSSFYEVRLELLEKNDLQNTIAGFKYLLELSQIEDPNIFMVVFETWNKFVFELYLEYPFIDNSQRILRRSKYTSILIPLLNVLIDKMPRPEEVFIVVNEFGDVVKEKMVETDQIEFYKKMKGCFYHLAFLMENPIKKCFVTRITLQLDEKGWSWQGLNQLCWAIGSIAGVFEENSEREFFINILKYLLALCEMKPLKADKAVIASNIMFIIGQYHRFLIHNKSFLKTVVKKLFEFMDEEHEGIQDMACDNFYKIVERCPKEFLLQREENEILVLFILNNLKSITKSLEFYQKRTVYEAILLVLREVPKTENYKIRLIQYVEILFASMPKFEEIAVQELGNIKVFRELSHLVNSYALTYKTLPETCESSYNVVFPRILQLLENCNILIAGNSFNSILIKNARSIKIDIVNLFINVVDSKFIFSDFINLLCEKVVFDYKNTSKEPEILTLATRIILNVEKDNSAIYKQIELFFITTLIEPTIPFLMKADENQELSKNFIILLKTLCDESFNSFFPSAFNMESFPHVYNGLLYALTCIKEISDLSLELLIVIYKKCYEQQLSTFFTKYYLLTLENILGTIFDKDMKANFNLQCKLLCYMIRNCNDLPSLDGVNNNVSLLSAYVTELFTKSFSNVTQDSIRVFVDGLFDLSRKEAIFEEHLKDFRVKMYEFGSDEYLQEELNLLLERKSRCMEIN